MPRKEKPNVKKPSRAHAWKPVEKLPKSVLPPPFGPRKQDIFDRHKCSKCGGIRQTQILGQFGGDYMCDNLDIYSTDNGKTWFQPHDHKRLTCPLTRPKDAVDDRPRTMDELHSLSWEEINDEINLRQRSRDEWMSLERHFWRPLAPLYVNLHRLRDATYEDQTCKACGLRRKLFDNNPKTGEPFKRGPTWYYSRDEGKTWIKPREFLDKRIICIVVERGKEPWLKHEGGST